MLQLFIQKVPRRFRREVSQRGLRWWHDRGIEGHLEVTKTICITLDRSGWTAEQEEDMMVGWSAYMNEVMCEISER